MLRIVKQPKELIDSQSKEIVNPVAALWEIELLFGKHPDYTENTYAVNFTTKLEGNASKCFLVIDLRDRFDEYVRSLNVFGSIEKNEFHKVIDYVSQLKVNGIFRRVPDLLTVMEGSASSSESQALYELVVEAVQSDPEAYPTISSNLYQHGVSAGVILDTEQYVAKYGQSVGITTEALLEIVNVDAITKSTRFLEIIRGWQASGILLKKSKSPRLQEQIKPRLDSKEVKRFYIFQMDLIDGENESNG
jgi:hypothetical protein